MLLNLFNANTMLTNRQLELKLVYLLIPQMHYSFVIIRLYYTLGKIMNTCLYCVIVHFLHFILLIVKKYYIVFRECAINPIAKHRYLLIMGFNYINLRGNSFP